MGKRPVYELFLYGISLCFLPKFFYKKVMQGKYKDSLSRRFGKQFPVIHKQERVLVWLHAGSVGETKAVAALAKKIKDDPLRPLLLISSTTETGHAEAKRSIPQADYHVYLPLDFRWVIEPIIRTTLPDLLILTESDYWYNLLDCCRAVGTKTVAVNARISERSADRFKKLPKLAASLFSLIDNYCVQSTTYKERFLQLGIQKEKIHVTGNLKWDNPSSLLSEEQLATWRSHLQIQPGDQLLVVGSTHDPEEKIVLGILPKLLDEFPHLKVLFVPRHPERFQAVADLITQSDLSGGKKCPRFSAIETITKNSRVILVDAMGLLTKCYQVADLAFVGGSYTPAVGGHNIIEPCPYGVPVLFGPYMHSQPELLQLVLEYGAGEQVAQDQLADTLRSYLSKPQKRREIGQKGKNLVEAMQGATLRTWEIIRPFLEPALTR